MTELNLFCFITNILITIFIGVFFPIMPMLTRKEFLFGVRIPESAQQHQDTKKLKSAYISACIILLFSVLLLNILQYIYMPDYTLAACCYFPFLIVGIHIFVFVICWKKATELKKTHGWQISSVAYAESFSSHSRGKLTAVPWIYYIGTIILIIVSVMIILIQYPSLPDPIPTHFDINMNPDKWSVKSIAMVLMFPLISFATTVLMAIVAISIEKVKLQISSQNPALSFAQHRLYRKLMGHGLGILTFGMIIGFTFLTFMTLWPQFNISFRAMMFILILPCVPIVFVSVISGQGGCKLTPKITKKDEFAVGYDVSVVEPSDSVVGDISTAENDADTTSRNCREEDCYWKLGMFYYNPADPVILVEDRFGNNIGFNYARLGVKIGVTAAVVALICLYVWMTPMLLTIAMI